MISAQKNKHCSLAKHLSILFTLLISTGNLSAENEILLQADRALRDEQRGITIYEGNVELLHGVLSINAARIEVNDKDKKIKKITALGNPAIFSQAKTNTSGPIKARSNRVTYDVRKGSLTLTGDASIQQSGSEFSGEQIIYDTKTEIVKASGSENEPSKRVRVVLQTDDIDESSQTILENSPVIVEKNTNAEANSQ